ncbi:MAG: type II toxin-antitoxin system Phd/YefM family antitoxin [Bacillota bacterium]|nr:type II toxin-antitoxin system Phd/YefM family antitoxin [Bacillota bacterium]
MPIQVNIHEAKTHLSKLLVRVKEGQEVIIAKGGKPIAKLIPIVEKPVRRIPGTAKNQIFVSPSFYDPLPDNVLEEFEK